MVVSNDDAGTIRFRINVANQRHLARDSTVELFIDSDRNPATGDPLSLGAEYRLAIDGGTQTFDFGSWDGTRFDSAAPSTTAAVWYWSGVSFTMNRTELGGTSGFSFWIRAAGSGRAPDAAPDRGTWTYEVGTGGVNPRDIDSFAYRVRPAVPRAGFVFQLRIDRVRLVEGAGEATPDRWSCSAILAGRTIRGSGHGRCDFRLPRAARGKRLVVTMTVAYMGSVVSGDATYRVR